MDPKQAPTLAAVQVDAGNIPNPSNSRTFENFESKQSYIF